jgi:hypothetical protein
MIILGVKLGIDTMVGVDVLQAIKNANKSIVPASWHNILNFSNLECMFKPMLIISNLIFASRYFVTTQLPKGGGGLQSR